MTLACSSTVVTTPSNTRRWPDGARLKLACALLVFAGFVPTVSAYEGAFTYTFQNDELTGTDNNYTHGAFIAWSSDEAGNYDAERFVPKWIGFWSFLPFVGDAGYDNYAGWAMGQEIFTPDDYTLTDPPLDDQPYAGTLYVESMLYARHERLGHTWRLRLGIVGPSSRAEQAQNRVHEWIGSNVPQGWPTQLDDEAVINFGYKADYLWREGDVGESARWRLTPSFELELGNWLMAAGAGVHAELGWNLPSAFGGWRLRQGFESGLTLGVGPQSGTSFSLFAGLGGYAIGRYMPLDGNLSKDSRSVDSTPLQGVVTTGFVYRNGRFAASFGFTLYSESFETERDKVDFGKLSLAWYF